VLPFAVLPALARPILDRLITWARGDARILAILAGGSAASGTMDEFSDLDLVVVCRDGSDGGVLEAMPERAGRIGPLLVSFTGEHVGEPRLLIALYGPPLLHVDLKVIALADLAQRVEDPLVVWERDGAASRTIAASAAARPAPDAQWIEDRFWVWLHYAAAKLGRGELLECLDALALMRSAALGPLIARRFRQHPQGVRRIERYAPELRGPLAATAGDPSPAGCAGALRACADLYRDLRADLGTPMLVQRRDAEREALAFLDEVRRRPPNQGVERSPKHNPASHG
jgi:predicted nucleotidyltransferase